MRRAGKVDLTQRAIVKALRDIGASVAVTSSMGGGFPDLVWSYHSVTGLLEVKSPGEKLTEAQKTFHTKWGARIPIVQTTEEAQRIVIEEALGAGKPMPVDEVMRLAEGFCGEEG